MSRISVGGPELDLSSQLNVQCSNLGPLMKQRKDSPSAKQASNAAPLPEALGPLDADLGEQEAYASSCSSDADEKESEVVHELEEEVRRLHDQVSGEKQQHGCLCLTTKHMQVLQSLFHA